MNQKRKKILLGLFVLCVLVFAIYGMFRGPKNPEDAGINRVRIREEVFQVEVAETPAARSLGLGNRDDLCAQCGMLFLFEESAKHGFWMKDMRFAIDIVWLRGDEVVWIERSIPPDSQKVFYPGEPADRVLELNAGALQTLKIGDRVEFLR